MKSKNTLTFLSAWSRRVYITIFTLLFTGVLLGQSQSDINQYVTKFAQTLFYLNSYYLDTINNNQLTDNAIRELLEQLDPHSSFVSAKDVKAMNEPLEGNFEGVGIEFMILEDTLAVANPISGGPCERVGIRAGDKIIEVNGENIAGIKLTNEMVFKYLRGPKGTKVTLLIKRKSEPKPLLFEVVRDKIPINSLDAAYEVEDGVFYFKLSRFAAKSAEEIYDALKSLNPKVINGVVLDLRGNSGGYLGSAFDIANMFLNQGQTIVYTEGLRVPKMVEKATGDGFYKVGPLAVLVDEYSASASEIVSGAIQDWDRGVVIGRRTFGKGLVQQMMPLSDGSQLRLTIARYHTPSGRVIQSPYKPGEKDNYYKALYQRYANGEMFTADSVKFPDSLKYKTLIKGRTVYGGGGIMPDIFVPADTTGYSEYYGQLLRRGILLDFMNELSDKNRTAWKSKYDTFESFYNDFNINQSYIAELNSYAKSKGLTPLEGDLLKSGEQIRIVMKAMAAKSLFGVSAYYRVINMDDDKVFKKALDYIKGSGKS